MADSYKMTEAEANRIFNYEMINKDWWNVTYCYDNIAELTVVLDYIYNIGKKIYEAEYSESQAGTRLCVRCIICNMVLSSYDPLRSHNSGKKHKKNVCLTTLTNKPNFAHVKFKPLNSKKGIFDEGSLEDMIDNTSHSVLGVQFVYKEVINSQPIFSCQLCKEKYISSLLTTTEMFHHLISEEHNYEYVDKIHKINPQGIVDSLRTFSEIEEREGKVCHKFATVATYDDPYFSSGYDKKPEVKKPSVASVGIQCTPNRGIQEFVDEIEQQRMTMTSGSEIPKILASDPEAQQLVIQTATVLTQKILKFATMQQDKELMNFTQKLAKHCENLRPYPN